MVATGWVPTLPWVDAHLKLLAEVSLAVERAEAAAGEGGFTGAREALDEAETGLQVLRERWPEMGAAERADRRRRPPRVAPASAIEHSKPAERAIGALVPAAQTKVQYRGWRFSAAGVRCALTAVGGCIAQFCHCSP